MEVTAIQCTPNRLFPSSENLHSFRIKSLSPPLHYRNSKLKFSRQRKLRISASSSSSPEGFSWVRLSQSIRSGSQRFFDKLGESMKEETGIDLDSVKARVDSVKARVNELTAQTHDSFQRRRDELEELVPHFIHWNKWEHWKDVKNWDPKRVGVLVLYALVLVFSSMAIRAPFIERSKRELTEAYMEALIPEPTPTNVRKFKKGMWRKTTPKGLKLKKFIEGPDGTLVRDTSFVGEDAWEDDTEHEENLNAEDKNNPKEELGLSVENQETRRTWRERLLAWKEILQKDKLNEQLGSLNAKYAVEFDMKEVENSLHKELAEKVTDTHGTRALWISKRWWYYRPRLPYTYFLQKLDSSEVAAVVFTEDLKRLYVTMKEGFPLEYTVDIPLDPLLFEAIASAGVEVDLLQKRQMHYFLKAIFALLPGLLLLWLIRQSIMLLFIVTRHTRNSTYTQLFDYAHTENFVVSINNVGGTKSMYNDVVVGGDVWDVVDELMMYMREPMRYHGKDVALVRGVLIGGPPGTGKTLLARTLAKKSGLPFVFASGAEFMDGEKSGRSKLSKLFYTARRNAPAFVFVDEIDAIAGRHAKKDPRRKDTLNALLQHLDGEKGTTGFDRFSFNDAVIFMCATNRPDELDEEFMRLGRIDRHVYIGLPNAKQRIRIFGIHSAGKDLAEDVDFEKLVFRTVRYSGADIRNLINEAAIMSVRKGHSKIYQEDIADVLDKQLLEGMGVLLTEEEQQKCEERVPLEKKRLLAVHEAGHVVLAHLFPRFDLHAFSQLLPGGKETAMSVFYPREEMHVSEGYMLMQMVVAHGGHCAERIVFGDDITDGSTDDLEKLTKIAREMVISPLNHRLGLTLVTRKISNRIRQRREDDDDEGERIKFKWDDPNIIQAGMTPEVSELFTRELTRYIEETEELAMKGLMDNRDMLDLIAKELLENMRITGFEVEEIIKGLSPIMFEDIAKPSTEARIPEDARLGYKPLDIYPAPLHR